MKLMGKNTGQKGGGNIYYLVMGALAAIKYFHDKDNGLTIQLPKVEVR